MQKDHLPAPRIVPVSFPVYECCARALACPSQPANRPLPFLNVPKIKHLIP